MNITPDQKSCRLRSCMIGWLLFYSMYLKDCLLRLVRVAGTKGTWWCRLVFWKSALAYFEGRMVMEGKALETLVFRQLLGFSLECTYGGLNVTDRCKEARMKAN